MAGFKKMKQVALAAKTEETRKRTEAADLERRRRPLRLKGQRSTRISRVTPDIFASASGQTKTLLG